MTRSSDGIFLRMHPFSESSLLVTVLTREQGVIRALAKGAKRPRSPFAGMLDFGVGAHVMWRESARSSLHTLIEVHHIFLRPSWSRYYGRFVCASYFAALVLHTVGEGMESAGIFDLLERAMLYLERQAAEERGVLFFEREIARLSGVLEPQVAPSTCLERHFGRLPVLRSQCFKLLGE